VNLENGKLKIRNATLQDSPILASWWNDGTIMAHAGFPDGIGISQKSVAEMIMKDDDLNRRLILEFEDVPIGEMSYRTTQEKIAKIGIKICDANQQDKGFGTEYLKMLIYHIFIDMGYDKIILDTNLKNKRAQHVYEKLGFKKTGTRINAWKNQPGEAQSSVDYELTKEDYLR